MNARTVTLICIVITIVGIAVYDTVAAVNKERGDTISEIVLAWAMSHPIGGVMLGVAVGILLGHLFWPQLIEITKQ